MNKFTESIPYDEALNKGKELMKTKKYIIGFFIIVAINTSYRASDILNLKYGDFLNGNIIMNKELRDAFEILQKKTPNNKYSPYIFLSQKNKIYRTQSINDILKIVFPKYQISTHSLRKTFGNRAYERSPNEKTILILSYLFKHSNTTKTKIYLGI